MTPLTRLPTPFLELSIIPLAFIDDSAARDILCPLAFSFPETDASCPVAFNAAFAGTNFVETNFAGTTGREPTDFEITAELFAVELNFGAILARGLESTAFSALRDALAERTDFFGVVGFSEEDLFPEIFVICPLDMEEVDKAELTVTRDFMEAEDFAPPTFKLEGFGLALPLETFVEDLAVTVEALVTTDLVTTDFEALPPFDPRTFPERIGPERKEPERFVADFSETAFSDPVFAATDFVAMKVDPNILGAPTETPIKFALQCRQRPCSLESEHFSSSSVTLYIFLKNQSNLMLGDALRRVA